MKSNIPVAAACAAAIGVLATLHVVGTPTAPAASPSDASASAAASVSAWLPGHLSPTAGSSADSILGTRVGQTGGADTGGGARGTGGAGGAGQPSAVRTAQPVGTSTAHPTSTAPVIPDHPVAMNDPAAFAAGAVATGPNPTEATASGADLSATGPAGVSLGDTFTLASRPGSSHTIFLDPRGATITGRLWNTASGYNQPTMTVAAYTHGDSDPAFDTDDLQQLQIAWMEVAADYAPYDVNVTLEPQSADAIGRSSSSDATFGTQVMLTSTPDPKGMGGIAWLGGSAGYYGDSDQLYRQPAFVWAGAGDSGHNAAQAAAHEAGHTWGLVHESGSSEYYTGSTTWAPIMGASYYAAMGQWSMGEFKGAKLNVTNPATGKKAHQDEVGTIRSVLGSAEADNGPDSSATPIDEGTPQQGAIESSADIDSYVYTGTGGVMVHAAPATEITDLDVALDVIDTTVTSGNVLTSGFDPSLTVSSSGGYSTPTGGLDASFYIPATDEPHTYLINVAGGGNGASPSTDATAYSAYGSLGSYTLDVTSEPESSAGDGSEGSDDAFSLDGITALTRTPGVPITFDVKHHQGDVDPSGVLWAWKSSKSSCQFDNAAIANPTLTCLATDTGAVTVTATASASGFPAQTRTATFALSATQQAAPHLALSVAGQTSSTVAVCPGNAAAVLATVTDTYGRPVYGASVRLFTDGKPKTVKTDLHGQVRATLATKLSTSPSFGLDSLASGVFPAQTSQVTRTVDASAAHCFGADTEVQADDDDVVVVPGLTTPLSATVVSGDGRPVTGVPVAFTDTSTTGTVKTLGSATTDAKGVATYLLKGAATIPAGQLKATVAKSTVVTSALSTDMGAISVASGGITADFDTSSFNINGVTRFAADGYREDKLITNVTSIVAGRMTAGFGATSIPAAAIPVSLDIAYSVTNAKTGVVTHAVKKVAGKTDANGWFRIPVKNPQAGTVSISSAKSGLFPAVADVPFDDSDGTQAQFDTKVWSVSVVPSATTVAASPSPTLTFTVQGLNPWPGGAAAAGGPGDVAFQVSGGGLYYPKWTTKGGSFTVGLNGLRPGTWTITPVASKSYTGVPTTFTVE